MSFWAGFEKRAIEPKTLARGAIGRILSKGDDLQKHKASRPGMLNRLTAIYESDLEKFRAAMPAHYSPQHVDRTFYRDLVDEMNHEMPSDAVKRRAARRK